MLQTTQRLITASEESAGMCVVYITMVLGQPAGFFKEVCLYADADWLQVIIMSVRECERSINYPAKGTDNTILFVCLLLRQANSLSLSLSLSLPPPFQTDNYYLKS